MISTDPMSRGIDNFLAPYGEFIERVTLREHGAAIHASAVGIENILTPGSPELRQRFERLAESEKLALENAKLFFTVPTKELVWVSSEGARLGHENPKRTPKGFDLGFGQFARYPGDPFLALETRVFCRCRLARVDLDLALTP